MKKFVIRCVYELFKRFPVIREASADAESKLYYEELDTKYPKGYMDPILTNLNVIYDDGPEPECDD